MVGGRRSGRSIGYLATLGLITAVVATPILVVLAHVGAPSGGLWQHLASTVLPEYVRNTLLLALGVGVVSCVMGVASAWLVTLCRFPGRQTLRWALLLPLAIPTYLTAYAYSDLLQFSGPVQTALRQIFEWGRHDYWFPEVRSLGGAIAVLAFGLYPYVYLAARTAFLEQSVCVLEVGRTLGLGPWRIFGRIALPLARPSIIAGLMLVLMETVAELGAVEYCAVDTFATGIYRTFTLPNRHALTVAAQLSACLLALILLLIAAEAFARRASRYHATSTRSRHLPTWQLRGAKGILAAVACSFPVLVGFVLPFAIFAFKTWKAGDARAAELFLEISRNTFVLAAIASLLAVGLALAVALARRLDGSWWARILARMASIGYAIPGGVIAIGILITVTWADHRAQAVAHSLFGTAPGMLWSGTVVALVYGYQTRFLAVSTGLIQAGLTRIRPSIDGAARTLGASPTRMVSRVHLPLLKGTILSALLLVFVDVIKELPATLILRPFDFDTLAVRVYHLASDERLDEASTAALAIILIGLIPVVILSRMLDRARPGSTDDDDLDGTIEPDLDAIVGMIGVSTAPILHSPGKASAVSTSTEPPTSRSAADGSRTAASPISMANAKALS